MRRAQALDRETLERVFGKIAEENGDVELALIRGRIFEGLERSSSSGALEEVFA